MDPELLALEAEICGGGGGGVKRWLGSELADAGTVTKSYYVEGDTRLELSTLNDMVSCQSGGMYGMNLGKEVGFVQSEISIRLDENSSYKLIVHKTMNKENELEVCSVSVFDGEQFVAYLFSTNDPLAFDNFNCYRGNADNSSKPALKSVEQLVFCENKVQINTKIVRAMDHAEFYNAAMGNERLGSGIIVEILKIGGLDLERPMRTYEDGLDSAITIKSKNSSLKEHLTTLLDNEDPKRDQFHTSYLAYFQKKLDQPHDLLPLDYYKSVGRDLCAVGDFLDKFDRYSLMCTISARMKQLSLSEPERLLVSALVPECVVECSKNDDLWGYIIEPVGKKKKLTWLAENRADGIPRLLEIVSDATKFQNAYINKLSGLITSNKIADAGDFLFWSDDKIIQFRKTIDNLSTQTVDQHTHRLGLSERLLQSLWTKQLIFPPELIRLISNKLAEYGITYVHYIPNLKERRDMHPLAIAKAIGNLAD